VSNGSGKAAHSSQFFGANKRLFHLLPTRYVSKRQNATRNTCISRDLSGTEQKGCNSSVAALKIDLLGSNHIFES
jgi:hypothetical protein